MIHLNDEPDAPDWRCEPRPSPFDAPTPEPRIPAGVVLGEN